MNISWVGTLGHNAALNADYSEKVVGNLKFSEVLHNQTKVISANSENQTDRYFPNMRVLVKTGNCDISKKNWDRNDFPFWDYYKENTKADSLNSWKATGTEPREMDSSVKKELKQIDFGAISILIPDGLQQKMDADPKYAEQIWKKISDWKNNYDRIDNALAISYGYDPYLHQLSKSYCLQLDENGNVEKHVVVSGGFDDPNYSKDKPKKITINKSIQKYLGSFAINNRINSAGAFENEIEQRVFNFDYSQIAAYAMLDYKKRLR